MSAQNFRNVEILLLPQQEERKQENENYFEKIFNTNLKFQNDCFKCSKGVW